MTKREKITPFMLAMITIALIVTLRGLPMLARYGLSSIFFYSFTALFFLIPVSLIAAELATAWPQEGGIFLWVTKAFGDKWGFVATFLQWIPIVIWYPTALSFIAAAISYIFNPELAANKYYILSVILIIYWGATFLNFKGLRVSGWVSSLCATFGIIIPAAIIIILGALWLFQGHPSQISFEAKNIIPDLSKFKNIAFLAGAFMIFAGMEIPAVHVNKVENPRKGYPKAVLMAVIAILTIAFFGTLSVAVVVPKEEISLVAGVLQAFSNFFEVFNLKYLVPLIAFFIALGPSGQVLAMILGPTKSMLASARRGDLPPFFKKVNKHDIPVNILITQGIIVTIFSMIFLFMPDVSNSFWILTVLTIQLYLIMYLFFYAAAIRLRYKYPDAERPYKVPGKNFGIWLAGLGGIAAVIFVFFVGFFPPPELPDDKACFFVSFLIIVILIMIIVPLVIQGCKKLWKEEKKEVKKK
jgi:putative glutamate/gamma-aminobutyrate antiporter